MGDGANRILQRHAEVSYKPAAERGRASERDLLTQHRPDRQLVGVYVTGDAAAGRRTHEMPDQRVTAQSVEHRNRVRVEVEQRACALDGGGEIAYIGERVPGDDVAVSGFQLGDARAVREGEAAAVDAVADLLHAW